MRSQLFSLLRCIGDKLESESKQRSKQPFNKIEKRFNELVLSKLRLNGHIICILSANQRLLTLHLGQNKQVFHSSEDKKLGLSIREKLSANGSYLLPLLRQKEFRSFKMILNMSQHSSRKIYL